MAQVVTLKCLISSQLMFVHHNNQYMIILRVKPVLRLGVAAGTRQSLSAPEGMQDPAIELPARLYRKSNTEAISFSSTDARC